jgi:hypothetical protein
MKLEELHVRAESLIAIHVRRFLVRGGRGNLKEIAILREHLVRKPLQLRTSVQNLPGNAEQVTVNCWPMTVQQLDLVIGVLKEPQFMDLDVEVVSL